LRKLCRFIPIAAIAILILIAIKFHLTHYLNYATLKKYHLQLTNYVDEHFFLTLLVFCLSYILIVASSIPGATFLTLLGGFLFGSILATTAVIISATIGATVLMSAIKLVLGEVSAKKIGSKVKGMENKFRHNAFFYVLSMRFLPIVPFFLISLAAGIFNMKIVPFFIATLIGIIPATFVYVNIGANLNKAFNQSGNSFSIYSVITPNIIIAFSLLAVLSLMPLIIKKVSNKRIK